MFSTVLLFQQIFCILLYIRVANNVNDPNITYWTMGVTCLIAFQLSLHGHSGIGHRLPVNCQGRLVKRFCIHFPWYANGHWGNITSIYTRVVQKLMRRAFIERKYQKQILNLKVYDPEPNRLKLQVVFILPQIYLIIWLCLSIKHPDSVQI